MERDNSKLVVHILAHLQSLHGLTHQACMLRERVLCELAEGRVAHCGRGILQAQQTAVANRLAEECDEGCAMCCVPFALQVVIIKSRCHYGLQLFAAQRCSAAQGVTTVS
jgi:hypothetical protein